MDVRGIGMHGHARFAMAEDAVTWYTQTMRCSLSSKIQSCEIKYVEKNILAWPARYLTTLGSCIFGASYPCKSIDMK